MKNIKNLIKTAITATIKAGKIISKIYESHSSYKIELKADNSPLTIADQKADMAIKKILNQTNLPILSEEGKNIEYEKRKKWKYFWLVDPLDGTKEFIKRNGEFTVNIALIHKQTPIAGVIYVPILKTLYFAFNNSAYKIDNFNNNTPININQIITTAQHLPLNNVRNKYTIVGSRSHMNQATQAFINQQKQKYGDIEIISRGSSLKFCMVAEGLADIYPRFAPTMEWDTAAGHAIILAVNKKVTLTDEISPLVYNKKSLVNPWFIVK